MALQQILAVSNQATEADAKTIIASASTTKGMSLSDVKALAETLGLNYQMAKRSSDAKIVVPAVINWRVGHYAALIGEKMASSWPKIRPSEMSYC